MAVLHKLTRCYDAEVKMKAGISWSRNAFAHDHPIFNIHSPAEKPYYQQAGRLFDPTQAFSWSRQANNHDSFLAHMSSSTAAVVGVTLACTVILTLLALLFFCFGCRRCRCRRHLHLAGAVPSKVPRPFIDLRGLSATSAPLPPPSISHLTNSSEMLSTQAVVAYASSSAHTSPTLPPYDVAPQETIKAQSALHPPEAVSTRPPSARSIIAPLSLPTPPAALPPGTWHAPPDSHDRALSLLRSLFSQGPQANLSSSDLPTVPRATDSGLRLYDDTVMLPPPYTQD
ncbi:hypothetical protein VTO73DRAFT_6912 [Trametes versicolor]